MNELERESILELDRRVTAIEKTLSCLILMLSDSKPLVFEDADDLIHLLADDVPAVRNQILHQLHRFKP